MKIEILHVRDSDGDCYHDVFIDGVRIAQAEVEIVDVDPGRGYERASWDENIAHHRDEADHSPAFRDAVVESLELNADSKYIVGSW